MGKHLDRAFDIMRERNRRYLEEQKKQNGEDMRAPDGEENGDGQPLTDEQLEELRQAEEKLRAYREQNDGASGVYRVDEAKSGQEPAKLEKGDVPAMILSAIIVFGPIFLVLIGLFFLAWLFLH